MRPLLRFKIIELVQQSKAWSSVEQPKNNAENVMMGLSEEELYNLPTAEYVNRRGQFLNPALTVYHVAFQACADIKNIEVCFMTFLEIHMVVNCYWCIYMLTVRMFIRKFLS